MSGDHNKYQKPRSYEDDDTQYDEAQVKAMIKNVVLNEREACAKVLFDYAERDDLSDSDESLLKHLFELIRARGES